MASVKVFTPNFRQINVKISPNMTILEILEEAARKAELNPNEHDLKHHRTVLDLTQMFRFSGLPTNCDLEMIPAKVPRKDVDDNDVGVVLQTETHGRVEGSFKPGNTMLEIISKLCPEEAGLETNPVIIYMRTDVQGAKLSTTTLKSLGLTSGRGLLRLIHKTSEELKTQANVSAPLTVVKPPKQETEESRPGPKKELKKEINILAAKKEEPKVVVDEAVPGPSKVEKPQKMVVEEVPKVKAQPVVKRNIEFTKEDLERIESETKRLDDKNTVIYSLESVVNSRDEELPDSFFDVTVNDIRVLFSQLKDNTRSMDNAPLMTSKLRELEDAKKTLNQLQYKETLIRIQFPNRMILQTMFKPIDTIGQVKEFIKRFINEDIQGFDLFTTPPKTILNDQDRLVEIHCVPQALIHFGTTATGTIIKAEFLEKLSTAQAADFLAAKLRGRIEMTDSSTLSSSPQPMDTQENNNNNPSSEEEESEVGPKKRIVGSTFKVSSTVTTEKSSLPKWFKTAK